MLQQNNTMDKRSISLVGGLYVLFLVNEFWLNRITSGTPWVLADLSLRFVVILILWVRFRTDIVAMLNLRPRWSWLAYIVVVCVLIIAYDAYVVRMLTEVYPQLTWSIGAFPGYDSTAIRVLDLSLGLVLVGVGEEILNRGFARQIYEQYFSGRVGLILVSAVLFTVMHWGQGVIEMSTALVAGVLLMVTYLRTGSLVPGIISHYLINLYFYL